MRSIPAVALVVAALALSACASRRPAYTYVASPPPSLPGAEMAYRADIPPRIVVPKYEAPPAPVARVVTPPAAPVAAAPRPLTPRSGPHAVAPNPASVAMSLPAPSSRPINATCPVLLGNPVNARFTSTWQGRVVAFSDATAKSMWDAGPSRYAGNLPGMASASIASPLVAPAPAAATPVKPSVAAPPPLPVSAPAPAVEEDEDCPGGNCRIPGR